MKNNNFCKRINESLKDEDKGSKDYKKLSGKAKNKSDKNTILGMSRDERRHYNNLRKIKRSEC